MYSVTACKARVICVGGNGFFVTLSEKSKHVLLCLYCMLRFCTSTERPAVFRQELEAIVCIKWIYFVLPVFRARHHLVLLNNSFVGRMHSW